MGVDILLIKHAVNQLREREAKMATSIATRAKFKVWSVKDVRGGTPAVEVELGAVTGGDGSENRAFWNATPSGKITMFISNPSAFDAFAPGQEFYVDFTPAI